MPIRMPPVGIFQMQVFKALLGLHPWFWITTIILTLDMPTPLIF